MVQFLIFIFQAKILRDLWKNGQLLFISVSFLFLSLPFLRSAILITIQTV